MDRDEVIRDANSLATYPCWRGEKHALLFAFRLSFVAGVCDAQNGALVATFCVYSVLLRSPREKRS